MHETTMNKATYMIGTFTLEKIFSFKSTSYENLQCEIIIKDEDDKKCPNLTMGFFLKKFNFELCC